MGRSTVWLTWMIRFMHRAGGCVSGVLMYIDGLAQDWSNSTANAIDICLPLCTWIQSVFHALKIWCRSTECTLHDKNYGCQRPPMDLTYQNIKRPILGGDYRLVIEIVPKPSTNWVNPRDHLGMGSANERRCYYVKPHLNGRAHTQIDPWILGSAEDIQYRVHTFSEQWIGSS